MRYWKPFRRISLSPHLIFSSIRWLRTFHPTMQQKKGLSDTHSDRHEDLDFSVEETSYKPHSSLYNTLRNS